MTSSPLTISLIFNSPCINVGKIDVDVLLDRPSSLRAHSTDSTEVAVNLIDHANSLDALLPSLALTGSLLQEN